ncbi:hypothetical protein ACT7C7_00300 [Bacillus cereus]
MTGEKNKDNRKIWFVTLAIVIAGVTFLNIFLYARNDETGDVKRLKVQNQVLQTENEELKKKVKGNTSFGTGTTEASVSFGSRKVYSVIVSSRKARI